MCFMINCVEICLSEQQFCGGKMTKPQGSIKTPNWPEKNYPPGISCSWLITVEPDKVRTSGMLFVNESTL